MANDDRDPLRQIKHIVVVMMENRSFDMMLGHLSLRTAACCITGDHLLLASTSNRKAAATPRALGWRRGHQCSRGPTCDGS
jgi:phospholipase C